MFAKLIKFSGELIKWNIAEQKNKLIEPNKFNNIMFVDCSLWRPFTDICQDLKFAKSQPILKIVVKFLYGRLISYSFEKVFCNYGLGVAILALPRSMDGISKFGIDRVNSEYWNKFSFFDIQKNTHNLFRNNQAYWKI